MSSFEQPPQQNEPQMPAAPEKPVPPENLPIQPEKKPDLFVDPELTTPEPRPLPKKIVERYAAENIDVVWLRAEDFAVLKSFENLPFADQDSRRQALNELLAEMRALRDRQEGWDEKTTPDEELPDMPAAPMSRSERASEKKRFDPAFRLDVLRKKSKSILATLDGLPEGERTAAAEKLYAELHADIEKFKEALLDQRRAVAKIIEGVRERIMGSIETVGGKKLGEVVDMFDQSTIHGSAEEKKKAQTKLFNYGDAANKRDKDYLNVYVKAIQIKNTELPEQELTDFVTRSMDEARLINDARELIDWTVEKIIDRRKAIDELMSDADRPEKIFRICFGRDPIGQVQIIPGPVTVYFRCASLEDYALIHSGAYAQGRDKVTDEERAKANLSGGVAGIASRADAKLVENDIDVYRDAPFPDKDFINERVRLLNRLDGALIAENAPTGTFLNGWTTYRHEEQHAIHHLTGQVHLARLKDRIATYVQNLKEKESETDAEVAELEREAGERSERLHEQWAASRISQEPSPDIESAFKQMNETEQETDKKIARLQGWPMLKALVSRYVEEMIEENGKDEILAYYLEGRLDQAVVEIETANPQAKKLKAILERTEQEEGLYDYHAKPWVGATAAHRLQESLSTYKGADGRANAWIKEAIAEHRKSYLVLLKKAYESIQMLEASGYSKRAVIDLLTVEPLRNWPAMTARMTSERDWKRWRQRVLVKAKKERTGTEEQAASL